MQYQSRTGLPSFLAALLAAMMFVNASPARTANTDVAAQQNTRTPPSASHRETPLSNRPVDVREKESHPQQSGKRGSSLETGSKDDAKEPGGSSPRESKEFAMSMLEGVLLAVDRISPVEYNVLTLVEAATLLWQSDHDRALIMLKSACETMRELREKDSDKSINSKQRRLRFLAFLKIARLKPDLVKDLALDKSSDDKSPPAMSADWSEEARAVMTIADEQIEQNPALAAKLVQQTFSLGQVDWAVFLKKLSARDSRLSEQVAMMVIDRLGGSSITPIYLLNFRRFVLTPERSAQLKHYFFQSLASRLRRNISPAVPSDELSIGLLTAQDALRSTVDYPRWQAEYEEIILGFQELLRARTAALGEPRNTKRIAIPMAEEIKPADTQEIVEAVSSTERINASKARDSKYLEMATKAASRADLRLAEEIISKIEDETIRRDASMSVYGPFVRKAIGESDWTSAMEHASKIVDPLGRTLVLDRVAQGMSKANKDKRSVKDVYDLASYKLRRESPSENVAKAFIILAKALSTIDPEESLYAVSWAVYILNKLTRNGDLLEESRVAGELAWWVSAPTFSLHEDVLDLTEMIGSLFGEMAKRDPNTAQTIAYGFVHQGLFSIAQLGVVKAMLEKARNTKGSVDRKQASGKSALQQN
jgi:hypothetical protein